jgi:hypothetical protein
VVAGLDTQRVARIVDKSRARCGWLRIAACAGSPAWPARQV